MTIWRTVVLSVPGSVDSCLDHLSTCHPPASFAHRLFQSMKSLIGAYDKIGESKPGDLTGDLSKFEEMSADEK